jgi:hypothetical protein
MCEALQDVIVRVMIRNKGQKFWLPESEAKERSDRGDVKIL